AGVRAAWDIAAASATVHTLVLGTADLSAQLGVESTPEGQELLVARSTLVLACAAAGRPKPIDGPFLNLDDDAGLRRSAQHARKVGFGGKVAIHPKQIPHLVEAFEPTPAEIDWAQRVVAAFDAALAAGLGV